jgi:1-acyl-sn-glycerol-3-phosphate acyltransferase
MRRTIFDTPILSPVLYAVAWLILRLTGWRPGGSPPDLPKFVLIGAPHTSNWDFIFTLVFAFIYRRKVFWMGKDSLFRFPFGPLFKWMGGIPIDRSKPHGVVAQTIETFNGTDQLILCIAPEGARKRVEKWKTGFYHVACGAGVPIALGFLDYKRRSGGFGPLFTPSGDLDGDMIQIRAFYATITGRHPNQFTAPAPKNGD